MRLILASKSPFRSALLAGAGLRFETRNAAIDERAVEDALGSDATPDDRAQILAATKALTVSESEAGALVIGCDQILALDGDVLHKADNVAMARRRLLRLSGRTHTLHAGIALALDGGIVWSHVSVAHMTMRELSPGFIGRHLAEVGDGVLGSVGCYQIEGPGLQLFERIDGDYWTIIGLPLLPLLAELRSRGVIDT
jgi:septum formation protein